MACCGEIAFPSTAASGPPPPSPPNAEGLSAPDHAVAAPAVGSGAPRHDSSCHAPAGKICAARCSTNLPKPPYSSRRVSAREGCSALKPPPRRPTHSPSQYGGGDSSWDARSNAPRASRRSRSMASSSAVAGGGSCPPPRWSGREGSPPPLAPPLAPPSASSSVSTAACASPPLSSSARRHSYTHSRLDSLIACSLSAPRGRGGSPRARRRTSGRWTRPAGAREGGGRL